MGSRPYRAGEELLCSTGHRGRPRDDLPVGAEVYPAADRCPTSLPAHIPGDRWCLDETSVKVAGQWCICIGRSTSTARSSTYWSPRDLAATRRFFIRVLEHGPRPAEVTTDRAPVYPRVIEELIPAACPVTEQHASTPVEADHGRLKAAYPVGFHHQYRNSRQMAARLSETEKALRSLTRIS
ncbi:MAG: DDE-type integrase/transposase/recombinase [Pseudonocardiaceae bacterium]